MAQSDAELHKAGYKQYRAIVEWARARYNPSRGDTSIATRSYNAIVVSAGHRYL